MGSQQTSDAPQHRHDQDGQARQSRPVAAINRTTQRGNAEFALLPSMQAAEYCDRSTYVSLTASQSGCHARLPDTGR